MYLEFMFSLTFFAVVNAGSAHIDTEQLSSGTVVEVEKPNVVILFADDLGYGDLGFSGHPTSRTSNIDFLASNGRFLTHFYVTTPICSPSRAALLTGRYPLRSGTYPDVYYANSTLGLPKNETTIANILKNEGYATQIVGKWHLGVGFDREYLPSNVEYGFDNFFGLPYSQDMCPCIVCFEDNGSCNDECFNKDVSCPLFRNLDIIEQPAYLPQLTSRYVNESLRFIINSHQNNTPFFLYLAFAHIHRPQFASVEFENKSDRGVTGDALLELDWAVGEIMNTLDALNATDNTLIWFTSDNGPSLIDRERGGCAGHLRCGKGTTWEGGVRVPGIIYWRNRIDSGRSNALASTLDILPTISSLVGADVSNLTLDGVDISDVLFDANAPSPRDFFAVYPVFPSQEYGPYAVIYNQYKAHFYTEGYWLSDDTNYDFKCTTNYTLRQHDPPELYNLYADPGERYDLSQKDEYRNLSIFITQWRDDHMAKMTWMPERTTVANITSESCCTSISCSPFPSCCDCPANLFGKASLKYLKPKMSDDKCSGD